MVEPLPPAEVEYLRSWRLPAGLDICATDREMSEIEADFGRVVWQGRPDI